MRGAELLVPRLVRFAGSSPPAAPIGPAGPGGSHRRNWRARQALCQQARHGVRHLILLSRRAPPGKTSIRERASEWGRSPSASSRRTLRNAKRSPQRSRRRTRNHPLSVVVHLAGALDDGPLPSRAMRGFSVLAPKVLGAMHLDLLCRTTSP